MNKCECFNINMVVVELGKRDGNLIHLIKMFPLGGLEVIKALVFDFDGLILDTETLTYKASAEIFEEKGAKLPISIWAHGAGSISDDFDLAAYFSEQIGEPVDRKEFYNRRDGLANSYIEQADILPGVVAILETAQKMGLKIGLATSSGDRWARNHLERLGIDHYFDAFVEANDVKNVKPDPEIFLKACEELGVKPQEAIAFEDSLNGAISAKAAGMYCVVVPNEVTKNLEFTDVDQLLGSMDETTIEELIELFEKGKINKQGEILR
jgi:HAD superfamily hydrolase (TIGR01509 family)